MNNAIKFKTNMEVNGLIKNINKNISPTNNIKMKNDDDDDNVSK